MSETVEANDMAALYDELVTLGRSKPEHQVTVPASVFAEIADHYHRTGYARGLAEPVAAKIREVARDDTGNLATIVEYNGVAARPAQ